MHFTTLRNPFGDEMSFEDVLSLTASEEAKWLHGLKSSSLSSDGFVSIGRKVPAPKGEGTVWQQKSYKLSLIENILTQLIPSTQRLTGDTYISQATFVTPGRKTSGFGRVQSAWVDLDYYDAEGAYSAGQWSEIKLQRIQALVFSLGLPAPSLIIDSGRGAYVKWMFTAPTSDLPLWQNLQEALVILFSELSSDHKSKDASRVLRCLQTVNGKNSALVSVIAGSGKEYDFRAFTRLVTEICDREVSPHLIKGASAKVRRQARAGKKIAEAVVRAARGNMSALDEYAKNREPIMLESLTERSLNWARFTDLRDLTMIRGGFEVGKRNNMLLWMCNSLAHAKVITSDNWDTEVQALLESFPVGPDFDPVQSGYLNSLKRRLDFQNSMKGGGLPANRTGGLYRPSNAYLINQLDISEDEQQSLKTIIGAVVKSKRTLDRLDRKAPGRADRRSARQAWQSKVDELLHEKISIKFGQNIVTEVAEGTLPGVVELGISVSALAREWQIDRTILSKHIKSKILAIYHAKDKYKSHDKSAGKQVTDHPEKGSVIHQPDVKQALKAIQDTTAKNKQMIQENVKREKEQAQSKLSSAVEKISRRAGKSKVPPPEPVDLESCPVIHSGDIDLDTKAAPAEPAEHDLNWAKEKVEMMKAAVSADVQKDSFSDSRIAPASQGLRLVMPTSSVARRVSSAEPVLKMPAKLPVKHPDEKMPEVHVPPARPRQSAPAPDAEKCSPDSRPVEKAGCAQSEVTDTQFYVFQPARPRAFPHACTWPNHSLPLNTMMGKSEWEAASQDGRYFVIEVLGHDQMVGVIRIINPDHPRQAELSPGKDIYGDIFAAPANEAAMRAVRALSGCTLISGKGRARIPEGLEEKACIFFGHQFYVSRPPIEYTVTSKARPVTQPVCVPGQTGKREKPMLGLASKVVDKDIRMMPSMDEVLDTQAMDADDALDELYASEGLAPAP